MPSPVGWPELPCARCGNRTAGIDFGELCPDCTMALKAQAGKLGRRAALAATAVVALWGIFGISRAPLARSYAAAAVIATYLIVRRVVERIALEMLK
ncbi:MAG: hypothetical protein ACREL2_04320 [Gemmatimonadales bacterium]